MREPPKLAESRIIAAVETHYRISTAAFSFLPLGNDSATSVYRLDASDGATWFVKLRTTKGFGRASLAVPQYLHAQGIPHLLAPLATTNGELWVMVGEFAMTVYPFIEAGRSAAHVGLTEIQWEEFGSVVRQFHNTPLPPELLALVPREQFVPKQRELIPVLEEMVTGELFSDDAGREVSEFWLAHQAEIHQIVSRADSLGAELRQTASPLVLCHADMHTYNLLVDQANEFWLVDWDEVILARPERDLMFVIGSIHRQLVTPLQTAHFMVGYGKKAVDPLALAYYRLAWAVQDMAAYGESVFMMPESSISSRSEAASGFINLFASGGIIEIALASEF